MADRTSGLDFSDQETPMDALAAHPDVLARAPSSSNLQRHKTERHRLQGLMRAGSNTSSNTHESVPKATGMKDEKFMDKWHTWLINGGQSRLIFGIYVFLHIIVITLGFMNYQLKDNQKIIRSIVGLGFGPFILIVSMHNRG
jgi:NADPH oxidase 2